ncbi:MAG: DUF2298 domain-containing protein, partial [Anaerolineales bacterium]
FDLATVYLMYVVVSRIYDKRVGLLATAFSSLAVLQIQLSHFFTVDIFANFFIWLALYFAARIATAKPEGVRGASLQEAGGKGQNYQLPVTNYQPLLPTLLFGAALGMAAASKISAAPVALMLPVAGIIYLYRVPLKERINQGIAAFALMALAAVISLAAFRIFQPYAFAGPGFFDLTPNERWLDGLNRLRDLLQPSVGYPPAVQWFDRSIWFSGQNLTLWGLGLPLGLTAWAGFLWVGWRIFKKGEWKQHLLIWGWVAFHFVWQSSGFNPTMRYQLSIYPGMAAFAAWAIIQIWDAAGSQWSVTSGQWAVISNLQSKIRNWIRPLALTIGALTLLGTFLWALAFSQIYNRQVTRIEASRWIFQNIPGPINVRIQTAEGIYQQPLPFPQGIVIRAEQPFTTSFVARADGVLGDISLTNVTRETTTGTGPLTLNLAFADQPDTTHPLAVAAATVDPGASGGDGLRPVFAFDSPIRLQEGQTYYLMLVPGAGSGQISLAGAAIAVESSWDDPIPYRVDGYDGFGGIYRGGLNFEMYWEDTADKRERFIDILNRADVIVITSSRQWASLTRLPGKYPITIAYYRNLLGCPADRTIEWCYNVAELGTFTENLGFELVKTFQSDPNLGPIRINDQFSEEAFTVYDHPKVFILVKSAGYDPDHVRAVLGAAPLASDQPLPAEETGETEKTEEPKTLLLPPDRLEGQQSGGTWSDLFNSDGFLNRFQVVTVLYWYLAVALLGVIAYPIVRVALPGLADRGYPLARTAGLLLLSYLVWLAGSFNIPFSRLTITIVALLIVLVGGGLAYLQRDALRREWREKRRYFATVEALSLALFLFLLFVRLGNPDLWHPWKGGEKPMDFAYFNAVLKS